MRIALISTPFVSVPPTNYGGTELVVHELVEGLVTAGHAVELFATGDSRTSATLRSLYRTAQWPPQMLPDLNHVSWAMQQTVARGPFDIIHAHSAVALACARFTAETPLVYTIHHDRNEELSAFYAYCQDAHYVAISEDQRRREIPLRHVDVIYHGLDPNNFCSTPRAAGDYVCFVGRFSRVKGPHTAIDAAQKAGVPIRVAGNVHPADERWVDAELRRRFDLPHVTHLGPIGLDDKADLLCGARALLAPIDWNEPFGLILVEAMLSGAPVVAFAHGSIPELVEHGVTGFIATSLDDMVDVIRPGGLVDSFDRGRCRARAAERFGRDRMVKDHLALYERIVRASRQRAVDSDRPSLKSA